MAEKATIARPYARAAFEHARSTSALSRWSELLALASQVVSDARVKPLLGNPHVGVDQLVEFVAGLAGDKAGDDGRNFLRALAANRRLGTLPEIAAQFEVLRGLVENVVDVEVVAAMTSTRRRWNGSRRRSGRGSVAMSGCTPASTPP